MSEYSEYFLAASSSVVQIDCIEIYHSQFSQIFRIVRNNTIGTTVKHENGISYPYTYYPLRLKPGEDLTNLDQSLTVELGDLGETIPQELSRITNDEKAQLIYRGYRSDNLNNVLYGPIRYEVHSVAMNETGCIITVKAPTVGINKTGEIYTLKRFPMLRGVM